MNQEADRIILGTWSMMMNTRLNTEVEWEATEEIEEEVVKVKLLGRAEMVEGVVKLLGKEL